MRVTLKIIMWPLNDTRTAGLHTDDLKNELGYGAWQLRTFRAKLSRNKLKDAHNTFHDKCDSFYDSLNSPRNLVKLVHHNLFVVYTATW